MIDKTGDAFLSSLDERSRSVVRADATRFGLTVEDILRRLIYWYGRQNDLIRGSILGTIPTSVTVDSAKLILRRMAEGKHFIAETADDEDPGTEEPSE